LELWFFFSFSSHTIVTWSFEFFCLFPLSPLLLGALNFSLTHKPKQTNTQALSHTLKTSCIWKQCKVKLGMKLIFTPCYFHFYFLRTLLWFSSLIIPKLNVFTPQSQLEELCNNFIF
jgi:hypothetical protein